MGVLETEPLPPETKYTVMVEEFLKAATGNPFHETEWFYKSTGRIIKEKEELNDIKHIRDKNEYIVVKKSLVPGQRVSLQLQKIRDVLNKPSFIFIDSILPSVILDESLVGTWLFLRTHIQGWIQIENNSESGSIYISDNSKCDNIYVSKNSKVNGIIVLGNSKIEDIAIYGNSTSGIIKVEDNSECGDISILDESKCNSINIDNSKGKDLTINSSQCKRIIIMKYGSCEGIIVSENRLATSIKISNDSNCESIIIDNNSKCRNLILDKTSQSTIIWINNNSYVSEIKIDNNSQCGDIRIHDSQVSRMEVCQNFCSVLLHNATVPLMLFSDCHLHQLSWKAGTKGELYIDNSFINHLNLFKTALLKDAVVSIINSKLYIAQLQELLIQGQLILRNIDSIENPFEWNPLIIKHVEDENIKDNNNQLISRTDVEKKRLLALQKDYYYEQLTELNINPEFSERKKPLFRIANSSLGKTEITGSDLSVFNVEYRDSKLLDAFISGTKLPKEKIGIYNKSPNSKLPDRVFFEQKVSIYNQLKKIYDNQGDIVESTWYHSKAMDNQERILKLERKIKTGKTWLKRTSEWFELKGFQLNNFSNNHGENWSRALLFIFLFSLLSYSIYYMCIFYKDPFSFSGTYNFIGDYFSFLDPLHKIDFLVEKKYVNAGAKITDFFGRLLIGYGIFQLISAYRRHGRKGV